MGFVSKCSILEVARKWWKNLIPLDHVTYVSVYQWLCLKSMKFALIM